MSSKVSSDDMAEFSKAFIIFDRDADGKVSIEELKLVRKKKKKSPDDRHSRRILAFFFAHSFSIDIVPPYILYLIISSPHK
jgi:Ca2+-binding EF-hand superfamily protein